MSVSQVACLIVVGPPLTLCAIWLVVDSVRISRKIAADRRAGR
jgi:hypothetical protein